MFLNKVSAFLKRDIRIDSSYTFNYIFQLASIFSSLVTFFFISRLMGDNMTLSLNGYGNDYFSFVIIGIAFSRYQTTALGLGEIINREQDLGTLEAILLTPTSLSTIIFAGSLYNIIETTITVMLYILSGIYLFEMQVSEFNFISIIIISILSITAFTGIGLVSTGITLIFKRGVPISWSLNGISKLLGGVYFPIAILPEWAHNISALLPITYSLEAIRNILLKGFTIKDLLFEILVLFLYSLLFISIGIIFLRYALNRCKREGSLTHV